MQYPDIYPTVDSFYYQFLYGLGEVSTWLFNQVKVIGDTIMNNPFLLVTTGIMLTGAAIGIFSRLLRRS